MFFIIGFIVVLGSIGIGYGAHGGNFGILWQPLELLIILGSGIGAFVIGNPGVVIKRVLGGFKKLMRGAPYKKKDYLDVLTFMFKILKQMKTKGMLSIEGDVENPKDSQFFQPYPIVLHNHGLLDMFCDTVRLMTMGMENEYQIEDLLTMEVDSHHHDLEQAASAVTTMSDGLPAGTRGNYDDVQYY
jgi:chemotaxis protein MotA